LEQELPKVAPPVKAATPAPAAPPPAPARADRGPYLPGLIVAGVGGAALVAGGVIGLIARDKATSATQHLPASTCKGTTCLPSTKPQIEPRFDSARDLGSAADGLLIGGATLLAVGVALWLIDPRAQSAVAAHASAHEATIQISF